MVSNRKVSTQTLSLMATRISMPEYFHGFIGIELRKNEHFMITDSIFFIFPFTFPLIEQPSNSSQVQAI